MGLGCCKNFHHPLTLMFYDKGSYASLGNFPSMEWILVNMIIATNCTDNILWLLDSWDCKLSIDHHLWTVRPVVKDLFMLKTKCWWIFKMWHSYLCHKTWELLCDIPILNVCVNINALRSINIIIKRAKLILGCFYDIRGNILMPLLCAR